MRDLRNEEMESHIDMTLLLIGVSMLAVVTVESGCAYRTQERALTASMVEQQDKRATMTNFMSAPIRPGSPHEETPISGASRGTARRGDPREGRRRRGVYLNRAAHKTLPRPPSVSVAR